MSKFSVLLKGQARTRQRIREVARIFSTPSEWVRLSIDMAVPIARHELDRTIKIIFDSPSGKLGNSYTITAKALANTGLEMQWFSDAPHARIHEKGGIIRPKKVQRRTKRGKFRKGKTRAGRFLHFKIGGKWIRTKRVRIRRKRYLTIAIRNTRKKIVAGVRTRLKRAHKRAGGGR